MASLSSAFNIFVVYQFVRVLSTPWKKQKAFKLGIIDEKGNRIKKTKDLTKKEKSAATLLHRLVWNIKRLIEKLPFGKTRLASYAAALFLLKEEVNRLPGKPMGGEVEKRFIAYMKEQGLWDQVDPTLDEDFQDFFDPGFLEFGEYEMKVDFLEHKEGDVVFIKQREYPAGNCLGENVYMVTHKDTDNPLIVSKGMVREKIHVVE